MVNGDTVKEDSTLIMGSNFGFGNGTSFGGNFISDVVGYIDSKEHIADANDTLQLVKFDVPSGKDDIVFVTWQAHPDNVSYGGFSSDYIGGLRYRMENNNALSGSGENYRVAFFQGAAGNLVASSQVNIEWKGLTATGIKNVVKGASDSGTAKDFSFNQYGYLIGQVALSGLQNSGSWKNVSGNIRNMQVKYQAQPTVYNEAQIAAAADYYANGGKFPYTYTYPKTNETVVLNSIHHANHINTIKDSRKNTTITMELNSIILGDGANSVAFVTAPGEMFDRYNNENVYSYADSATSGWTSIANNGTYGTPIIMGYSNAATGYVPNRAAFHYNEKQGQTGVLKSNYLGIGSYEANTSNYVEGTGEIVMAKLKEMLTLTSGKKQRCEHCGEDDVEFTPLARGGFSTTLLSGHYYLAENVDVPSSGVSIAAGQSICLDLNGYTLSNSAAGGVFTVGNSSATTENACLNIMDSSDNDSGVIQAPGQLMLVRWGGCVNVYGGTLRNISENTSGSHGGTVYITHKGASFTLHDGVIYGGKINSFCNKSGCTHEDTTQCTIQDANGGTIYLWGNNADDRPTFTMNGGTVYGGTADRGAAISCLQSTINLNGGTIIPGTLNEGGIGDCVLVDSNAIMSVSGDIDVDNIHVNSTSVGVSFNGRFAGRINNGITFASKTIGEGTVLGTVNNLSINSTVRVYGKTDTGTWYLGNKGADLVATATDPNTIAAWVDGTKYETMDQALGSYNISSDKAVKLNKDITYTLSKDVYLDLNGHDANITVNKGTTVYVMDSSTDDFKGSYGKITISGAGNVVPVTNSTVISGSENKTSTYIMLDEGNNVKSFHRLDLGVESTDVNPKNDNMGVRYACGFDAGEDLVVYLNGGGKYGVAVSIQGDPAPNGVLRADAKTTSFSTFRAGGNAVSSSYITNIMTESNGYTVNKRNAAKTIYGRAYVQLPDGTYLYGPLETNSLQSTVETINESWDQITLDALKKPIFEYYNTFKSVMKTWNIGKISTEAEAAAKAEEEGTMKILFVGSSHSMDTAWMLYEVYQQRAAKDANLPKLELGILYYSGCSINHHVGFAKNELPAYVYYKINEDIYKNGATTMQNGWQKNGEVIGKQPTGADADQYVHIVYYNEKDEKQAGAYYTKNGWTLKQGLQDEQWDLVVLQEGASYLGQKTMSNVDNGNLDWLVRFVKTNAKKMPQFVFHAQWADPMNRIEEHTGDANRVKNFDKWYSNGDGVLDANDNRLEMQRTETSRMLANTKRYFEGNSTYKYVVNAGAAISYAFEHYTGSGKDWTTTQENYTTSNAKLYRDYTHLSDYGRLITANLWFEQLFDDGVLTAEEAVTTIPSKFYVTTSGLGEVSPWCQKLLVASVNHALKTPYEMFWLEQAQ